MKTQASLALLKTAYQTQQLLKLQAPAVLFLGRSNVGKSSLLNAISGKNLAQISKQPGKTRSINYYRFGRKLMLVDLPGYGYAKRSKQERNQWAELIQVFFEQVPPNTLAYLLMDSRRALENEEFDLIHQLNQCHCPVMILFTKSDRLKQSERQALNRQVERDLLKAQTPNLLTWRLVSSKNQEGIEALRRELYHYEKEGIVSLSADETTRP